MGAVFEEFKTELAEIRRRHAENPRREMVELFLMALEREELVSVGYRESLMTARLAEMPIDDEFRRLIHHALVWIWKDEEMHTIYIRGAILRLGSPWLKLKAFARQLAGGIGGWAASAIQHTRWRRAPFSRLVALIVTKIGEWTGKVPADVKEHLQFGSFRKFCEFNIDAEKTAWYCWDRLAELAREDANSDSEIARDFAQVAFDEARHGRVFEILAESLDDDDRLVDGVTVESIAKRIAEVDRHFLPRELRGISAEENRLGTGGKVFCIKGSAADDKFELFDQLLAESGLRESIQSRSESLGKSIDEMLIAIKPAFMMGYHRADPSPIVDPKLLNLLAEYLRACGCSDIAVIEGPNIYDRFYEHRSVREVAAYFEIQSPAYRMVDAGEDQMAHRFPRGMAQYSISETWKEADFRITFSKLRSHPIELAYLSVGNMEWLGERCDEYLFMERKANRQTAVMMLLDAFPPQFSIIDGYDNAPDGLVGMMGCENPPSPRRLYAGIDALAVDTVAARHIGMAHPRQSSILQAACHWFGGWSGNVQVVGCDEPIAEWRDPYRNEFWALLSFLAGPMYTLGSGRGRLFVPEMDTDAFPFKEKPGWLLQVGRWGVRWLLGLRLPRNTDARRHHDLVDASSKKSN